jgi:hypothetical protein
MAARNVDQQRTLHVGFAALTFEPDFDRSIRRGKVPILPREI